MNFTGLLVGLSTFLIIGLFHPLVIKAEYYLGVVAFSSFWSILEVIHQRERVRKGWFSEGPGHKK